MERPNKAQNQSSCHRVPLGLLTFLKPRKVDACNCRRSPGASDRAHGFGSWPLGPFALLVFDSLALFELLEANTFDSRHMKEQVLAASGVNEPEPAICD